MAKKKKSRPAAKSKAAASQRRVLATTERSTSPSERTGGVAGSFRSLRSLRQKTPGWYLLLVAVAVGSPTILSVYGHNYGYSPDLHMASIIQISACLLLGLFFLSQLRSDSIEIRPFPVMLPAVLFVLWALITLIWAHNRYEGVVKLLDWGGAVLTGLLVVQTLRSRSDGLAVFYAIFASGMILLLLGVAQYFFDVKWVDQHARPAMTFNNKNMAAQYTLLFVPVGFALALYSEKLYLKILLLIGSTMAMGFILLSDTRGAIVAMLVQLAVFLFFLIRIEVFQKKTPIKFLFVAGLGVAAVIVLLLALSPRGLLGSADYLYSRVSNMLISLSTLSGETRFPIWINTFQMFKDHLFLGVGVGNWMVEYPAYHFQSTPDIEMGIRIQHINTHQDYLEMASEMGLIGVLLLAGIMVQGMRIGWKLIGNTDREHYLIIAILAGLAGLAVNAFGSFPFQQPAPVCVFMVYLGLLDLYNNNTDQKKPWLTFSGRRYAHWIGGTAMLMTLLLVILHYRWYQSEVHFRRSMVASRDGNINEMLTHGLESLKWSPNRWRMGNFIASGYLQRGETGKAIEYFEKVQEHYPYMMHTLRNTAFAYNNSGRPELALKKLLQLLEIRPDPSVHMNVGNQLIDMGRYAEAIPYLEKALELQDSLIPGTTMRMPGRMKAQQLKRVQQIVKGLKERDGN